MKPSVEARHVLGEKKAYHPLVVARRIGQSIVEPLVTNAALGGEMARDIAYREADRREAEAEKATIAAMEGVDSLPEIQAAYEQAQDGLIRLAAETPNAVINAVSVRNKDPKFAEDLERWTIKVTTKHNKPLESLFTAELRPKYDKNYRQDGTRVIVESLDAKTHEPYVYFNDIDDLRVSDTVARCFSELQQASGDNRLKVEVPSPAEQVAV